MINLDHAATTPLRREVLDAMLPYFSGQYANASGSYADARKSRHAIDQARRKVAEAIGAKPQEIYFTSGGTESDNWAVFGAVSAKEQKRHILTTRIEHHAVLNACSAAEERGVAVTYLQPDSKGRISPQSVRDAIRPNTALVSVMLANNEVGTIEPIEEIAQIARENGSLMHTDAVQAVGHIPVNVSELGVDLLSISAHKFGGPKGIGALFIRSGIRIGRYLFGGEQERGLRAGTENTPAIVGMGKALTLACCKMTESRKHVSMLRDRLQHALEDIPGVSVNGDPDHRLDGHLHLSVDGANSQLLLMRLDMEGIAASSGSACASGSLARSHVVEALGHAKPDQADIRFTIGENNTIEEIDRAAYAVRQILMSR